jgi:hypothetical protein
MYTRDLSLVTSVYIVPYSNNIKTENKKRMRKCVLKMATIKI